MKRSTIHVLRNTMLAATLAIAPLAQASDDTHEVTVPRDIIRSGPVYVMETVLYNVRTGQRTVITEECEASIHPAPALSCVQINPERGGVRIYVKTMRQ